MEHFKIKPELIEEFKTVMGANCCDGYSFGVVHAVVNVMTALDDVACPVEIAHDAMNGLGITGFMAGAATSIVAKYHERGNEYRIWWNAKYGVQEAQAKGGTVNPAIMTFPG